MNGTIKRHTSQDEVTQVLQQVDRELAHCLALINVRLVTSIKALSNVLKTTATLRIEHQVAATHTHMTNNHYDTRVQLDDLSRLMKRVLDAIPSSQEIAAKIFSANRRIDDIEHQLRIVVRNMYVYTSARV